jgi:hypothetical protein
MNICHPDSSKSCAACCGLYNVIDGRREVLNSLLIKRTFAFRKISRTVDAISDFSEVSRTGLGIRQWDPEIHVCEYTGFVDDSCKTVGCMLHPHAPGNNGIDFRGLCYYGSMACKAFFCPAASEIDETYVTIVNKLITDWHLYGLVATDINFLNALFALIEMMAEGPIAAEAMLRAEPSAMLMKVLGWKTSWPFAEKSAKRRSSYYLIRSDQPKDEAGLVNNIVDCLCFTFDFCVGSNEAHAMVRRRIHALVKTYKHALLVDK